MNLKLRFALLFAALVSIILIISSLATYYLFANHREEDFKKRLNAQAVYVFSQLTNNRSISHQEFNRILANAPAALIEVETFLLDSSGNTRFKYPSKPGFTPNETLLNQVRERQTNYFVSGEKEGVILYLRDGNEIPYFLSLAAHDMFGKRKENNLAIILVMVSLGGIILSAVFAFLYITQLGKPLQAINEQIQAITEKNLQERVAVPRGFEELSIMTSNVNEMLDRLEKAFEVQRNFVHHASHELRTPLAIMLSQTESALGREMTADQLKQVLLSLKEDQQAMIELTNSLLLLSQYEKVTFSDDWPLVRLDEIVFESIASIKRMYPTMNVSVDFKQLPEDENFLTVHGNEALLRSAVRNLLKNGYTYSDDKQVQVFIDADDEEYHISFENKGKLVPEKEREKLFLPFFRAENSLQKKGFGLGLSIVKRITSMHKGGVDYESHGTSTNRFTLHFPKK